MLNKKEMGQKISELRKGANLSQKELGIKLGYQQADISRIEKGTKDLTFSALVDIAQLFNVSTDYLLGVSEAKTNNKDLQFICDYTGLYVETINELNFHKRNVESGVLDYSHCDKKEVKSIYYNSINHILLEMCRNHYENIVKGYEHIVEAISEAEKLTSYCDEITRQNLPNDIDELESIDAKLKTIKTAIIEKYDLHNFQIYKIEKDIRFNIYFVLNDKLKEFFSKKDILDNKYNELKDKLNILIDEAETKWFDEHCTEEDELNGNDN